MAIPPYSLRSPRMLLPLGFGLIVYILVLDAGSKVLGDPDVFLHITVGRWIIAHGSVPHEDIFSHTMRGAPWVPHEWLGEVIFAYVYDYIGAVGLVVLTGVLFAFSLALLLHALLAFLAPRYALVGAATAWLMCLPNLLARPHALVFPLLVGWVAALVFARDRNRAPSLFAALLMLLWANLHGSYILGLAIAAMFGGEALLESKDRASALRVLVHWGAFGLVSLVAAAATPNGISGLLLPFEVSSMSFTLSWITEWAAPDFQSVPPLEPWLLLVLAGALLLRIRLPVMRVVMLLILLHMSLQHRRHGALLGILTPLLIAPSLAGQLPQKLTGYIANYFQRETMREALPGAAAIVVAAMFLFAVGSTVWRRDLALDVGNITPAAALAAARQNQVTGPVFNDYKFGGFLIFSGVPTFIDGRADMYGDKFVQRFSKLEELPGLLNQYDIGWTLLGADNPGALLLDHLPGWRRLYGDDIAIVHVREKAPAR